MEYQFESLGPALRIVVLVFLLIFALLILGLIVFMAILPGRIAKARSHPQAEAIAVCGWVGLPTGILWAIALVWAFLRPTSELANPGVPPASMAALADQVNALERSIASMESKTSGRKS